MLHYEQGRVTFGRWEYLIQALIVLSMIFFAEETLPGLSDTTRKWLPGFEVVSVSIFTVEYVLRIFLCRPRWRYALTFFGVIDLLAILPFYIATGLDWTGSEIVESVVRLACGTTEPENKRLPEQLPVAELSFSWQNERLPEQLLHRPRGEPELLHRLRGAQLPVAS